MAMTGCASVLEALPSAGPVYRPKNVYRGVEKLPRDVKRVAVLPLRVDGKEARGAVCPRPVHKTDQEYQNTTGPVRP